MSKESHLERTAKEPRDPSLHTVTLGRIDQINPSIRIFRLGIPNGGGIRFLPGQWLDVYVPSVPKAGGFTITSPPSKALPNPSAGTAAYLELAVQKSPDNPAAQWLWQEDESAILGAELQVRVGGSFVWPPPGIPVAGLRKVVFVAGGVGINPLVSMLSHLAEGDGKPGQLRGEVVMFYAMKDPGGEREADGMLFVERIANIFAREKVKGEFKLFLTPGDAVLDAKGSDSSEPGGAQTEPVAKDGDVIYCNEVEVPFSRKRIAVDDVAAAIGQDKRFAVVYICGVPTMTDEFVEKLTSPAGLGLEPHRVQCEKWW